MEEEWIPKTKLGRMVKEGKIKSIDEILDKGLKIMEAEIVDYLLPDLQVEYILIGEAKGKFGGGRRRPIRVTSKKTAEGNRQQFSAWAIVGNGNGYVGLGFGKAKETAPAKQKAIRNAKLNLIKIKRGCGSWECGCGEPHSIPFEVWGRSGSVRVVLRPAPKGTGLVINDEGKKLLRLAGIKDVWSKAWGQTETRANYMYAIFDALKKLREIKPPEKFAKWAGIVEGSI